MYFTAREEGPRPVLDLIWATDLNSCRRQLFMAVQLLDRDRLRDAAVGYAGMCEMYERLAELEAEFREVARDEQ
ncbi:MAG: hypothetical protein L0Y54_12085, partial [Sporichthyaceae bacterium]|nr:hypothetical protein [Sporichthyaceae bacterium]